MADETSVDWESEAKKAFELRDKFRAKLEEMERRASLAAEERSELERLKAAEADAEERRKVDAGEWEALKQSLSEQKAAAEAKAKAAEQRYAQKVVESAFAGASDLFGPSGSTVLTPDFAYAGMGRHVRYVPGENGSPDGVQVVGLEGEVIRGENGRPASFADGMKALIDQWPGKDQILRSGQRAGSGSAGSSGEAQLPVSRAELAQRAASGDKAALSQWRSTRPQGRTVEGLHWEQQAADK